MESNLVDEVYNISSGSQTTILELCRIIMKIMGKDMKPEFISVDDNTLVTNRIGSTRKAKEDLGYESLTTLEEGLRRIVEWKISQKNSYKFNGSNLY